MKGSNLTLFELLLLQQQNEAEENHFKTQIRAKNRDEMFLHFSRRLRAQMSMDDFISQCATINDREGRIRIVKPFFRWIPSSHDFKNKFRKSQVISSAHLKSAQLAFNNGNYQEALTEYNQALAHAPPGESHSSYGSSLYWRSLILFKLNDPFGALQELDLALTISDFPENDDESIKRLRATYKSAIEQSPYGNYSVDESDSFDDITLSDDLSKSKRQMFVDDLFRLKSPNLQAPALEDFVRIKQDGVRGRHLVTTKDVPIGTTLLVEKPMVSVLDGTLQRSTFHCHHCLKRNLRRIPCPNCVFAFFCDGECLTSAQPYHQYECPCLPDLYGLLQEGVTEGFYLAFKLLCIIGPSKPQQLFLQKKSDKENPILLLTNGAAELPRSFLIKGCDPDTGVYDPESYLPLCHLTSIFESQEILFPLLSLMLAHLLELHCPAFFDPKIIDPSDRSDFRDFLAEHLLHHYESFWKNMFSLGVVAEFEDTDHRPWFEGHQGSTPSAFEIQPFASRVFSTASLINHSCDANVKMFSKLTFGTGVIIALKSLKEGEELLMSYGPQFFSDDKEERQSQLAACYNFTCACIACKDEWREIFQNLESVPMEFCCPKCCADLHHDRKTKEEMAKITLNEENNFQCSECKVNYDETDILNKFTQMKKAALYSRHLLEDDNPLQAQEAFRNILEYFQNNLVQPSYDLIMSEELFCEAIYKIIHFTN